MRCLLRTRLVWANIYPQATAASDYISQSPLHAHTHMNARTHVHHSLHAIKMEEGAPGLKPVRAC